MKKLILLLLIFCQSVLANSYEMIDNPKTGFERRVELIQKAQKEILVNYFIFDDDRSAKEVLALLRERAKEGIKVQIMIDSYFNGISKGLAKHLMDSGVEIKNYAPFNLFRPGRWIKRMHNKLLIVDDLYVLTGSRNIQDEYYDRAAEDNFHDRDILIVSESVNKNSKNYFNSLWNAKFSKVMKTKRAKDQDIKKSKVALDQALFDVLNSEVAGLNNLDQLTPSDIDIQMIFDPMRKKQSNGTAKALFDMFENATDNIIIETPYFVLTRKFMKAFKNAVKRGVKIRVLTNSLASTDALLSQGAYLNRKRRLLKMGVEIHEYTQFEKKFHAKSFLIDYGTDHAIGIIGSYNFNARSHKQDFEMYATSRDPQIVEELHASMEENLKLSVQVLQNGKLDTFDRRLPHTTFMQRFLIHLARFTVIPLIKSQL
jgi:putative cardiolipin synthase